MTYLHTLRFIFLSLKCPFLLYMLGLGGINTIIVLMLQFLPILIRVDFEYLQFYQVRLFSQSSPCGGVSESYHYDVDKVHIYTHKQVWNTVAYSFCISKCIDRFWYVTWVLFSIRMLPLIPFNLTPAQIRLSLTASIWFGWVLTTSYFEYLWVVE